MEPMSQSFSGEVSPYVKNAQREVRMGFVRKVYAILSAQLFLTCVIAAPICYKVYSQGDQWLQDHLALLYVSVGLQFGSMLVMICCGDALRNYPLNYIFLLVFTCCMSVLVGFVSATYTWQSVLLAAGLTVLIFLAMTVYAWNTTTDFTGFGPYIFAALMVLSFFGLFLCIASFFMNIQGMLYLYDFLGVLIFTFFIVYDTQLIIGGNHKCEFTIDEYVFAALNLYLDIIQLFLHLLRLLGTRRD